MFGDSKSSAQATEKSSHWNWVQEGLEVAPNGSDAPIFVAGGLGVDHGRLLKPEEVSQPEGTIHLINLLDALKQDNNKAAECCNSK